jgi:hypothetical protein
MHDPADEALIQEIVTVLDLDHQYTRLVEEWNHELVAQIRRCGRQAGKRLGYKIRTLTSDPQQRDDRRIAVWVLVRDLNPRPLDSGRPSTWTAAHRATVAGPDLWVIGQEVARSGFRRPSPAFADLREEARLGPLEAMSADMMRTPNVGAGPVVTHEPGFDLRFSL